MGGPGPKDILDVSFVAAADCGQYIFVTQSTTAGQSQVATSAAEGYKTVGISQHLGKTGKMLLVRLAGISLLVANEALAIGDNVGAEFTTAADRGKGRKVAYPTKPGASTNPVTGTEGNAIRDYAENIQNWVRDAKARVLETAAAQNEQVRVLLNSGPF